MKEIKFYDREGTPVAYMEDNVHIFKYDGVYPGFLGNRGWVYDHHGRCVLFTETAAGGPLRPNKKTTPTKAIRRVRPVKKNRNTQPGQPTRIPGWSKLTPEEYFTQERTGYYRSVSA